MSNMEKNNFFAGVHKIVAQAVVCILLLAVVSCKNAKDPSETDEDDIPFDVPIDVPFTKISLLEACECGWVCGWVRANRASELIIINSDKELRRHVICVENVPTIDFSRYTLLLARGRGAGLYFSRQKPQQLSYRNYVMNVYLGLTFATAIFYWHIAIIIDKLDGNDIVELNVIII